MLCLLQTKHNFDVMLRAGVSIEDPEQRNGALDIADSHLKLSHLCVYVRNTSVHARDGAINPALIDPQLPHAGWQPCASGPDGAPRPGMAPVPLPSGEFELVRHVM